MRRDYDERIANALAQTAGAVSFTQSLAFGVALLATVVFALAILKIRDRLVKPIQVLNDAAFHIGEGRLGHRIATSGDGLVERGTASGTRRAIFTHAPSIPREAQAAALSEAAGELALRAPMTARSPSAPMAMPYASLPYPSGP